MARLEKLWQVSPKVSEDLQTQLLANRGIVNTKDQKKFFQPHLNLLTPAEKLFPQLSKAINRIKKAVINKELIYIYGDFDVDGITACAILWETLDLLGAKVLPYIPERVSEGYGLHKEALTKLAEASAKVVISVDCGITALAQADYAKELGIDLIITDHHQPQEQLPKAFAILHTTTLAGSGVAFKLANSLLAEFGKTDDQQFYKNLELATLGTVADMVPLAGENRIIVKNGLLGLSSTERKGLKSLYNEAGVGKNVGTYEIGHLISPRLNAMGRMDSALDSLRLLLTRDTERAQGLAVKLDSINQERQEATLSAFDHARQTVEQEYYGAKLFVVSSHQYAEGVVGLVAGRLAELFHRPSIVISEKDSISKGSARSISGFNVTEALHQNADLLLSHGGHPMAAGFSILKDKIPTLRNKLTEQTEASLEEELLKPKLTIDCEIKAEQVNATLLEEIKDFEPFGIGNPEPIFLIKNLKVIEAKTVGKDGSHLRLVLKSEKGTALTAVAFGLADKKPSQGSIVDVVCNVRENYWNSSRRLELRVKDLRKSEN